MADDERFEVFVHEHDGRVRPTNVYVPSLRAMDAAVKQLRLEGEFPAGTKLSLRDHERGAWAYYGG